MSPQAVLDLAKSLIEPVELLSELEYADYKPEIYVMHGPTATVAEVRVSGHIFTGSCKLHPNDDDDPAIGEWLAISRALEVAARTYKKAAWRRVNATR